MTSDFKKRIRQKKEFAKQGDQILRIFARWVITYFGQCLENITPASLFIELLNSIDKFKHGF
jgi:hypothetical protein